MYKSKENKEEKLIKAKKYTSEMTEIIKDSHNERMQTTEVIILREDEKNVVLGERVKSNLMRS